MRADYEHGFERLAGAEGECAHGLRGTRRGEALSELVRAPGGVAGLEQVLENGPVLHRVHRRPEAVIWIGDQLALFDQAVERLLYEVLAFFDEVEDLPAEDEVAGVDPDPALGDVLH